jgi:hypothetical protein
MLGSFNEEALEKYAEKAAERAGVSFSEGGLYDFTRCVRPDGSSYGTGGKCRKGTEGEKEEVKKVAKEKTPKKETTEDKVDKFMESVLDANSTWRQEVGLTSIEAALFGPEDTIPEFLNSDFGDGIRETLKASTPAKEEKVNAAVDDWFMRHQAEPKNIDSEGLHALEQERGYDRDSIREMALDAGVPRKEVNRYVKESEEWE